MSKKGNVYLIPMLLGDGNPEQVLPTYITEIIKSTCFFIVENERTARRFLRKLYPKFDIDNSTFFILNKHTKPSEVNEFLEPAIKGNNIGVISESGCPAIADPGAKIVELAHKRNLTVKPLVGPSSILLALMASGMNGQSFSFNGYLPVKQQERKNKIKYYESTVKKHNQAQLFIETPYRNNNLLEDFLTTCDPNTMLCIATDITLASEQIKTRSIKEWKKNIPNFHKKPTVFILGSVT